MILSRSKSPNLAPLMGLAALTVLALRPATLGGGAFYDRDIHLVWHPQVEAFVRAVANGSWPVWDAYTGFGQTLWGNPTCVPVLYPLTWAHLLMSPWVYYTVFSTVHLLFSGVGLLRLGRHLGLSREAALVAAGLWLASGPVLSLLNVWNHFVGAAWIPWVVLAWSRAWETGEPKRWILAGFGFGVQVLAGSPDMAVVAVLGSAATTAGWPRGTTSLGATTRRALLGVPIAATAALTLSAGQWLPTLEAITRSVRATLPAEASAFWSVPPVLLLQTLLPILPQDLPLQPRWASDLYADRAPFLASIYLGASALGLVAAGLSGRATRRRNVALLGLLLVCLLGALGSHTPVYRLLANLLPPLRWVRYPAKLLVGVAFAWGLLAGQGFDAWRREGLRGLRMGLVVSSALLGAALSATLLYGLSSGSLDRLFLTTLANGVTLREALAPATLSVGVSTLGASLAFVLCLLGHGWVRARAAVPWGLAVLAVGELVWFHGTLNPVVAVGFYRAKPPVVDVLQPPHDARVYTYEYYFTPGRSERYLKRSNPYLLPRSARASPARVSEAVALRSYLYPPVGVLWGLRGSYDGDVLDLASPAVASLTDALHQAEETPGHLRLLQMAGVERVVALHSRGFESLRLLARLPSPFPEPIHVFAVPDPLPRSYVVGGTRAVGDAEAGRTLLDAAFDPQGEIVVPKDQGSRGPAGPAGSSRIVGWWADRVAIEADLERPGYVVLLDGYDPGWSATVDGQTVAVVRANLAFRAVAVGRGHHRIEFRYRPASIRVGLGVTLASVVVGLLGLARPCWQWARGVSAV